MKILSIFVASIENTNFPQTTQSWSISLLTMPSNVLQQADPRLLSHCHTGMFDFLLFQLFFFRSNWFLLCLLLDNAVTTLQCWHQRNSDLAVAEFFLINFQIFSKSQKKNFFQTIFFSFQIFSLIIYSFRLQYSKVYWCKLGFFSTLPILDISNQNSWLGDWKCKYLPKASYFKKTFSDQIDFYCVCY